MKCRNCYIHPELRQSGMPVPKDLKCPVCDDLYDSQTGRKYDDLVAEEEAKKKQHDIAHAKYMDEQSKKFADGLNDHLKRFNRPKTTGGFHRNVPRLTWMD